MCQRPFLLAPIGREGLTGMICVEKIGDIRRAYFEQGRTIKEVVRTLSVSRETVRKVVRGDKTEFSYARGVQPTPKLGDWVKDLTTILETELKLPNAARHNGCSRSCADADTTARMTVCIGSPRHGATSALVSRRMLMCR